MCRSECGRKLLQLIALAMSTTACPEGESDGVTSASGGSGGPDSLVSCCYDVVWKNAQGQQTTQLQCVDRDPLEMIPLCLATGENECLACDQGVNCNDAASFLGPPQGFPLFDSCSVNCPATGKVPKTCSASDNRSAEQFGANIDFLATINSSTANAVDVTVNGTTRNPSYNLKAAFDRRNCGATNCTLTLHVIDVDMTSKPAYGGYTVESATAALAVPVSTTVNKTTGAFTFTANSLEMWLRWEQKKTATGQKFKRSLKLKNSSTLTGTVNMSGSTLTLNGTFSGSLGGSNASVTLNTISGSFVSI